MHCGWRGAMLCCWGNGPFTSAVMAGRSSSHSRWFGQWQKPGFSLGQRECGICETLGGLWQKLPWDCWFHSCFLFCFSWLARIVFTLCQVQSWMAGHTLKLFFHKSTHATDFCVHHVLWHVALGKMQLGNNVFESECAWTSKKIDFQLSREGRKRKPSEDNEES